MPPKQEVSYALRIKQSLRHTARAQAPEMAHPILCVSQLTPSDPQNELWSTACVLSEGQEDELAMLRGIWCVEKVKRRPSRVLREGGNYQKGEWF